jgi:hypothetical protein
VRLETACCSSTSSGSGRGSSCSSCVNGLFLFGYAPGASVFLLRMLSVPGIRILAQHLSGAPAAGAFEL